MVKGIKSETVGKILKKIPIADRKKVKEVSVDMANSMKKIVKDCFPNSKVVIDRFHVAQLISDAVQEIRIKHRWEAIKQENKKIKESKAKSKKYVQKTYKNGDTKKQLLARSRYLLFKPQHKWTKKQVQRAKILFNIYPDLKHAYNLSMNFRNIYETALDKSDANNKIDKWLIKVKKEKLDPFITTGESIINHKKEILNYFENRTTNALAECFNSKIKAFRATFRGVRDISFFLYRVSLIFA